MLIKDLRLFDKEYYIFSTASLKSCRSSSRLTGADIGVKMLLVFDTSV